MVERPTFKLLVLPGSLRRQSASKAIARTLRDAAPADVAMTIFDLGDVPIYNEDFETDPPAAVRALREAVAAADGLVVVSPEYNHGMSGVTKNAVDWVSRPGYASILVDKGVAIITTSESPLGGARAQADLHAMFSSCFARVAPGRQVCVGNTGKTIVDGKLVDEALLRRAMALVDSLLDEICLSRGQARRSGR
jgi:chromate reductase, NAD(P)H dehydrogenase (quinone)